MKADLNAGFSDTVSDLALIILLPMEGSFAHDGMNPHLALNELSYPFIIDDDDFLAGGDVIAGSKISKYLLCLKLLSDYRNWGYPNKSATHITYIIMEQEFVKREPLREPYIFTYGGGESWFRTSGVMRAVFL